ncbi:MAG: ferredoxin [Bacteroidetes bacterium]|nr:ferredoxin [Bacteroidota bacterium]
MKIIIISSLVLVILFIIKEIFRKKNKATKMLYLNQERCTGCGACLKKCRRNVLAITDNKSRKLIEIQNPINCTVCNDCVRACKFKALSLVDKPIK